jgi:hypothetical protein
MNSYIIPALFLVLTAGVIYFSKGRYDSYMVEKYGQQYADKAWKVYGVRTQFYRISIIMGFVFTIVIAGLFKLI